MFKAPRTTLFESKQQCMYQSVYYFFIILYSFVNEVCKHINCNETNGSLIKLAKCPFSQTYETFPPFFGISDSQPTMHLILLEKQTYICGYIRYVLGSAPNVYCAFKFAFKAGCHLFLSLWSILTSISTSAFCARILNIAYDFPISGVKSFGSGGEMVFFLLIII